MAVVPLTAQKVGKSGLSGPTRTALASGNTYTFRNNPKTVLHFQNTGSEAVVTITTPKTVHGEAVADPTVTIPATTGDVFLAVGSLPDLFNNGAGLCTIAVDTASGVTAAVIEAA